MENWSKEGVPGQTPSRGSSLSLTSAKQSVDHLLEGQAFTVNLTTVEQARQLAKQINDLGAVCEISNDGVRDDNSLDEGVE